MNPNTFFPAERRARRRRKTAALAAGPGWLVVTGIPIVTYDEGEQQLYVDPQFDTTAENPLVGLDTASPGKWRARYDGMAFTGIAITQMDVNRIELTFVYDGDDEGPNQLVYTNAPSDIADESGRQLAAFERAM